MTSGEPARNALTRRLVLWASLGPAGGPQWVRAASVFLFAASAGWVFLHVDPWLVVPVVIVLIGLRLAPMLVLARRPFWRAFGWLSAAALGLANLLAVVVFAMYGSVMAWNVPFASRLVTGLLALLVVLGPRLAFGVRVPLALPMAVWGTACVANGLWQDVGRFVQCDDYRLIRAPVEVIVPTRRDFDVCRSGASLPIGRYPRHVWEAPDESRYLFTSQTAASWNGPVEPADTITGLLCETPPSGTENPRCIGGALGTSQGIIDAPALNRLFVGAWDVPADDGTQKSLVMTVPLAGPVEMIDRHELAPRSTLGGDFIYQPRHDRIWLFGDNFTSEWRRASDFGFMAEEDIPLSVLDFRYDTATDEGMVCGYVYTSEGLKSVAHQTEVSTITAVHGSPLVHRDIVSSSLRRPFLLGMPFGCEFDPEGRKVYASFINLGVVAKFDYDSGDAEKLFPLAAGVRALAYDRVRRRLYVANFARGDVTAVDVDTGAQQARWFVGRFPRDLRMSRDGNALLVASTIGLLRIRLTPWG